LATALVGVAGSLCEIFIVCMFLVNFYYQKPILIESLGAFPKVFPVRLVWLSSTLLLFGGGLNSASAYMWAMASESIPSERRQAILAYVKMSSLMK